MGDHNIQMKKNTNGKWNNLYPFTKTDNIYDLKTTLTLDKILDSIEESFDVVDQSIGDKQTAPEWLQGSVVDSLSYLDHYMRDNYIDITKEPWNVPVSNGQDASEALQYALDNVPIRKTIYIPNGRYLIKKPVVLKRELTIEGQSAGENGGTLIEVDFSNLVSGLTAFQIRSTAKNSTIKNLYLKNITPEITSVNGIGNTDDSIPVTHLTVSDVWAVGFSANFFFGRIYLSRFIRCYAVNGFYGFNFLGECTSLLFETCYANKNTDNYRMLNILYSTFISCANDAAARYGYEFIHCQGIALVACGVETAAETAFKLTERNRGIHFQAPFTHNCGMKNTTMGTMFQIENGNYGIVIDSAYEYTVSDQSEKTLSIVTGRDTSVTVNSATTVLPIIKNIPSMIIDGQRQTNVTPTGAEFKQGTIVYNSSFTGTGVYAFMCIASGKPGTWVELTV